MARFLTAEWRNLLVLNFVVNPAILQPYVPAGTTLDLWEGCCYVSLVGFRFFDVRVLGARIPFHSDFDEVNLRFYLKRELNSEIRRGVAFVREIVPLKAVALVARLGYREPYVALPMRHAVESGLVGYEWQREKRWNFLKARIAGEPQYEPPDSEASFILEHYWGYTRLSNSETAEYQVEHPSWRVWPATEVEFQVDAKELYGSEFIEPLSRPPESAFVAEGSAVVVHKGVKILA